MNTPPNPDFDALVSGLKEDMRDPVVRDLLHNANEIEKDLNKDQGRITPSDLSDSVELVNSYLTGFNLYKTAIHVTGKVRISRESLEDYDDGTLQFLVREYGEILSDEDGPYFDVVHKTFESGEFDIVSVSEPSGFGNDRQLHRLYIELLSTIENEYGPSMYVYLSEIEDFTPAEASVAKMVKEIRENYPEIDAQIDSLPEDCKNDKQIIDALSDFVLEIDWGYHASLTDEERAELISYIEHAIADRLQFDISDYEFSFGGDYYKKAVDGENMLQDAEGMTIKRGKILGVGLSELDSDTSEKTYVVNIVLWSSVARRGGGNEYLLIPVYSIDHVDNLRNPYYESETVGAVYGLEDDDYGNLEIRGSDAEQSERSAVEAVETESFSGERVIDARERCLVDFEQKLKDLFAESQKAGAVAFEDDEDRSSAQQLHSDFLRDFLNQYGSEMIELEFSGPGIVTLDTKQDVQMDEESTETTIKITDGELVDADIFTSKKGFVEWISVDVIENEDDTESLVTLLNVLDGDMEPPVVLSHEAVEGFPFVKIITTKRFIAVADSEQTSFTIPELERIRSAKRQIEQITSRYPDTQSLTDALSLLHEFMASALPTEFKDFPDIELMTSIGKTVAGNTELVDRVSTLVLDIMSGAPLAVEGDAYNDKGELQEGIALGGIIVDIVPEVSHIPENEPMIKIEDRNSGIHYVPFSKITSMRI